MEFDEPAGPDPATVALKQELTEIILWNENTSPRSTQVAIGPSEIGDPCDRRMAYRLANMPRVNEWQDPWPAIVGTSIHNWLEVAMNHFQQANGDRGYLTELRVFPDPLVRGRSDVYNTRSQAVIDWKSAGPDTMRKVKKGSIPEGYQIQLQIYGLGHERAGRPVKDLILVFLPRSGWLGDMFIHKFPYDVAIAKGALERMYKVAYKAIELDVEKHPNRFEMIEPTPGDNCVWCPWFVAEKHSDQPADEKGCPGR